MILDSRGLETDGTRPGPAPLCQVAARACTMLHQASNFFHITNLKKRANNAHGTNPVWRPSKPCKHHTPPRRHLASHHQDHRAAQTPPHKAGRHTRSPGGLFVRRAAPGLGCSMYTCVQEPTAGPRRCCPPCPPRTMVRRPSNTSRAAPRSRRYERKRQAHPGGSCTPSPLAEQGHARSWGLRVAAVATWHHGSPTGWAEGVCERGGRLLGGREGAVGEWWKGSGSGKDVGPARPPDGGSGLSA